MSYYGKLNSVRIYIDGLSARDIDLNDPPDETYADVMQWNNSFENSEIPRTLALKLLAHLLADRELGS